MSMLYGGSQVHMGIDLDETIATKADQEKFRNELDKLRGDGHKCPKCSGALAHSRLKGYFCMNPSCPGPFGGGRQ